jgi:hypothetical protein
MTIKTFRGLLADGAQERIRLETLDGKQGYRITKLEGISVAPGAAQGAHVIKIYTVSQTTIDGAVDLSDNTLIGIVYFTNRTDELHSNQSVIIADSEIFNQDIYITHSDIQGSASGNYYLELERIKLDDVEATAVILKNFRNTNTV